MVAVLTKLALITGDNSYGMRAQAVVQAFAGEFARNWISGGGYLNGFECLATGLQMVVVGKAASEARANLSAPFGARRCRTACCWPVENTDELPPNHPVFGKPLENGQPTVYLCQRSICSAPITSAVVLSQALTLPQQRGAAA